MSTTPALYFVVSRSDDGFSAPRENVRVLVADTQADAEAEAQTQVGFYTRTVDLYSVTDTGYRGDHLVTLRYPL